VTLLRAEFQPSKLSPSRTYGARRPHVGQCPTFLVLFYFIAHVRVA